MLCVCRSWSVRGHVVEQQGGAAAAGEELLQGEDLPAIAQRLAGQQAQLRQRVEHHAGRVQPLDRGEDLLDGGAELDLGGVEQGVLLLRIE
jgi:hypothetical protein